MLNDSTKKAFRAAQAAKTEAIMMAFNEAWYELHHSSMPTALYEKIYTEVEYNVER